MKTREILLKRIWEDLKQADVNRYYALELIDVQTKRGKFYNLFIAVLSGSGALMSFINDRFPFYASILVLATVVLNQFLSHLFYNADYCAKLCQLHTGCYKYMHLLQDLYMKYHAADMDDNTAEKRYGQICETYAVTFTEISQVFGKINKKTEKIARAKSKSYLESIYF
jgi:hypothetical protein